MSSKKRRRVDDSKSEAEPPTIMEIILKEKKEQIEIHRGNLYIYLHAFSCDKYKRKEECLCDSYREGIKNIEELKKESLVNFLITIHESDELDFLREVWGDYSDKLIKKYINHERRFKNESTLDESNITSEQIRKMRHNISLLHKNFREKVNLESLEKVYKFLLTDITDIITLSKKDKGKKKRKYSSKKKSKKRKIKKKSFK